MLTFSFVVKNHWRCLAAVLIAVQIPCCTVAQPVGPANDSQSTKPIPGVPLRGSVNENTILDQSWPPKDKLKLDDWQKLVKPRLKPGLTWKETLLPQARSNEFWLKIPAWLAGTWRTERADYIYRKYTLYNQMNYMKYVWGSQQDALGGYWHLTRFPYWSKAEGEHNYSYELTTEFHASAANPTCSGCQPESLNAAMSSMEIVVSKTTGKIQDVRERFDTTTFRPFGKRGIEVHDDVIIPGRKDQFTASFKPVLIQPFSVTDIDSDGFDMHRSLAIFLQSQGMSNLVPAEIPAAPTGARQNGSGF